MPSRPSLLVLIPLCALVGCATVRPVPSPEVSLQVPPPVQAPPLAETPASTVGALGAKAEEAPPAAPARLTATHAEAVASDTQALLQPVAGVISAALEAAALLTGPASGTGRFWDELLTHTAPGLQIVKRATQLVGVRNLGRVSRQVPNDCSGFVRLAYLQVGIDLVAHGFLAGENAVSGIFRRAMEVGSVHRQNPNPGDLVFFRETYDRNRDGKRNDGMTHIAVVEGVDADGTVTFIHRGSKGVARGRMNLSFPTTHRLASNGTVLNDFIRPAAKGSRAYLAGELFAAFASPGGL
ncbi:hypothetical protein DRW03_14225 [Corallococcus sp. H22C18031201]|uniref:NlpC/P60 family protein n=1 Tax=Citreicoccus inhibens TaxID=2849499 RepID=UPI000E743BF1|nr:CHAP domain-containing protein [Citreicoccus inhibens]MBU8895500.1 CHAP domain-containing protein [Citreicoccus inhibens]RJS22471.1 hypothetical protein DRW03_14225 [Corallococcus sp. H22C18031201]